jgi:hypothetical protein
LIKGERHRLPELSMNYKKIMALLTAVNMVASTGSATDPAPDTRSHNLKTPLPERVEGNADIEAQH